MPYRIHLKDAVITPGPAFSGKSWNVIFDVMKERGITTLDAGGRITEPSDSTRR